MTLSAAPEIQIAGIPPTADETAAATCRARLSKAADEFLKMAKLNAVDLRVRIGNPTSNRSEGGAATAPGEDEELTTEARAKRYQSRSPLFQIEQLIVAEAVRTDLLNAASVLRVQDKVFRQWGLSRIEPFPRSVLNFHGPSGTGKTMAAHALAHYLNVPILAASYADIESKYLGSGPRNLEALFFAAERDGALLFVDEADSLLSARVNDAQSGSEKAVNSLRSQLLICLERFRGVVIFASNFVESYDKAFKTRVRDIHFPLPDADCRRRLWMSHLPPELPLASDVTAAALAEACEGLCGRDIKNIIVDAAVRAALADQDRLSAKDFGSAIERLRTSRTEGRTPPAKADIESIREKVLATAKANPQQ